MLQYLNQTGRLWLGCLLLMALLLAAYPVPVAAQTAVTIRIEPEQARGDPGRDLRVQVVIEDVENLGFFQFDLTFDPAVVRAKTVTLGEFLASTDRTVSGVGPTIDNEQGKLTFGAYSVGDQAGPDGTGVLAEVTLTGVANGIATLKVENVITRSTDNIAIVAIPLGTADVTIGATPTPTRTAAPTSTATVLPTRTPTITPIVVPTSSGGNATPSPVTPPAGTTPSGQTPPAPIATPLPTQGTPTSGPTQATPTSGPALSTSVADATPVAEALTAQPPGTGEPVATALAAETTSTTAPTTLLVTVEPPATAAIAQTETPASVQPAATAAATPAAVEPSPTVSVTPVAVALQPSSGLGASARETSQAQRLLLGIGVGALGLAGIIAVVIIALVLVRRKSS